jgi:60 kDa SS-A/Ro ribonucleoprotein
MNEKSSGWSRIMRTAITSWYLEKDPKSLVMHITKYPQREGWSHRDLLRLAHPKVSKKNDDALVYDQIFRYVTHGKIHGSAKNCTFAILCLQ